MVYQGVEIDIWFNAVNTMGLIKDLDSDELPFINAKIGNAHVDFEGLVDSLTTVAWNRRAVVRGRVTDQPLSNNSSAVMMWETGRSVGRDTELKHCTYDMKECYDVKTIPVLHNVSSNAGYMTGGQNLTIQGFGFEEGDIEAKVDGQKCTITAKTKTSFDCTTATTQNPSVSAP